MHKILVEEKRWVSENRFLHALNYTMLLPGPEAQQLATYLGWLLHLTLGGLMAGSLFIVPASFPFYFSVFSMPATRSSPWSRHSFTASSRQCSHCYRSRHQDWPASAKEPPDGPPIRVGLCGVFFVNIPFPVIVLTAGLIGYLGGKVWLEAFDVIHQREIQATDEDEAYVITDSLAQARKPSLGYAARVAIIGLLFWSLPLLVSWL